MSDIIERLIAPSLSNINANDTENDSVDEGDEDNQWKRSLIPSEVIKDR